MSNDNKIGIGKDESGCKDYDGLKDEKSEIKGNLL